MRCLLEFSTHKTIQQFTSDNNFRFQCYTFLHIVFLSSHLENRKRKMEFVIFIKLIKRKLWWWCAFANKCDVAMNSGWLTETRIRHFYMSINNSNSHSDILKMNLISLELISVTVCSERVRLHACMCSTRYPKINLLTTVFERDSLFIITLIVSRDFTQKIHFPMLH